MSSSAVLSEFVKRFSPSAAKGLSAIYELQLTGNGGESWHLIIANQQCQLCPGPAEAPDVAVSMSVEDWQDLLAGRLDPFSAYLSGRLMVKGDLALATRLESLFNL